jgi:hypothetical protein
LQELIREFSACLLQFFKSEIESEEEDDKFSAYKYLKFMEKVTQHGSHVSENSNLPFRVRRRQCLDPYFSTYRAAQLPLNISKLDLKSLQLKTRQENVY